MIIGLSGRARSGKTTAAEYLQREYGFEILSLSAPLKQMALDIDPIVDATPHYERLSRVVEVLGWEFAKDAYPDVRRFLQRLGTEGVRGTFGVNAWVNLAEETIWDEDESINWVIPDVRFSNEAAMVRREGGYVVEVRRDSQEHDAPGEHPSEAGVESDHVVINEEGEPAVLFAQLDALVGWGREEA